VNDSWSATGCDRVTRRGSNEKTNLAGLIKAFRPYESAAAQDKAPVDIASYFKLKQYHKHGPAKKWEQVFVEVGGHTFAHTYVQCNCGQAFVIVQHGSDKFLGCFEASDEEMKDARNHMGSANVSKKALKELPTDEGKSKFYMVRSLGV
jgi:hypothetical protein